MASVNPRKWRYTWEAQSHVPILKLFLFNPNTNPTTHCIDLNIDLKFEKTLLVLTWKDDQKSSPVSLTIPLPRVLVDLESPLNFRALDDHFEVKIALLLPVDHPIVSSFVSELNSGDEIAPCTSSDGFLDPLSVDSDFESLSSKGELEFYCRNCALKLTKKPIRCLADLPSVNWTDVADNWFGGCCCSFGGISEKMVAKYVKSYSCAEGTYLLTSASVILCKDDIAQLKSLEVDQNGKCEDDGFTDIASNSDCNVGRGVCHATENPVHGSIEKLGSMHFKEDDESVNGEFAEPNENGSHKPSSPPSEHQCCTHGVSQSFLKSEPVSGPTVLQDDQKSFLNCYLGNAFLFRSSGLSKEIEWIDFACPECSCLLGAYPRGDGSEPLDGGIRLLKFCISISPPSSISDDLFRKYTLERMLASQLLESAKDELSFRTVVKDLKTKSPMLQIVLLNPNSWCSSGDCVEDTAEPLEKINLYPVIKVLFSHCDNSIKSELRITEEWETKNRADEIYMLTHVIREIIKSLERAKDAFPPSFSSSEGFLLSSLPR